MIFAQKGSRYVSHSASKRLVSCVFINRFNKILNYESQQLNDSTLLVLLLLMMKTFSYM